MRANDCPECLALTSNVDVRSSQQNRQILNHYNLAAMAEKRTSDNADYRYLAHS